MPLTSPRPSLTLSFRRAEVTAFWILTSVVLSLGLGLAAAALRARAPWTWGIAGLCLPLPGFVWPQWFEIGVRAWNKGVRLCAAVLRTYVLNVCYYVLVGAVSRAGSSLDVVRLNPDMSGWIPRTRHDSSQSAWSAGLRPVLLLLRVLGDESQDSAPPSGTYTLY